MSAITNKHKYSNLYDLDGNILRKSPLTNVTIEELEKMIDDYKGDKTSHQYKNMIFWLYKLYNEKGNPHEQELKDRLFNLAKQKQDEVKNKLEELKGDLSAEELSEAIDKAYDVNSTDIEDINFEEIENSKTDDK